MLAAKPLLISASQLAAAFQFERGFAATDTSWRLCAFA